MSSSSQIQAKNSTIASYYYSYGVTSENNRKIEFCRKQEDDPKSLQAIIMGKKESTWLRACVVEGEKIRVELLSTSEKAKIIMEARQKLASIPPFKSKNIREYSIGEQDDILKNLTPIGKRKIEIYNDPGGENGMEKITSITIFDPS